MNKQENSFKVEISNGKMIETLNYNEKTYVKRYEVDKWGYHGLDQGWEYEEDIPDELTLALEEKDELLLMNLLVGDSNE